MTKDGILRHASFQGVRSDKEAKDVKLETAVPIKNAIKSSRQSKVKFSHLDKVLYEKKGVTKQQLVNYYENIAPHILPYIINRPLTLVRCPADEKSTCFYQKHVHGEVPEYLYAMTITEKNGENEYLYIKNLNGLLSLVQMDVIEIHPWGSKVDKVERPDNIVFDLDPSPGVSWAKIVAAANVVRKHLLSANLQSFVRTSGGKGLHIAIPIARRYTWDEVKNFSKAVATTLAQLYPNDFIATMSKEKRKNKIFIDYLRNGRGATAIASYSTRARKGMPVAMPVFWDEISSITPLEFTIENVSHILQNREDPWRDFFTLRQKLPL